MERKNKQIIYIKYILKNINIKFKEYKIYIKIIKNIYDVLN